MKCSAGGKAVPCPFFGFHAFAPLLWAGTAIATVSHLRREPCCDDAHSAAEAAQSAAAHAAAVAASAVPAGYGAVPTQQFVQELPAQAPVYVPPPMQTALAPLLAPPPVAAQLAPVATPVSTPAAAPVVATATVATLADAQAAPAIAPEAVEAAAPCAETGVAQPAVQAALVPPEAATLPKGASFQAAPVPYSTAGTKVRVDVYYETLCPTSQYFLRNQLRQLFADKELSSMVDLKLEPFGNGYAAWSGSAYSFQCQHGEAECVGNKLHACALQLIADPSEYVPFFSCMADYGQYDINDAASTCATQQGIDLDRLQQCAAAPETDPVMFSIFRRSNALVPPRTYVPWVLIDGVHSERAEKGYIVFEVCEALKMGTGGSLPAACSQSGQRSFLRMPRNTTGNADFVPCYGPGPRGSFPSEEV